MKYAIQINTSPYASNLGYTALQFVHAAINQGHDILRIFFYQDGIYHACRYATPASDETLLPAQWTALAQQGVDLVVCISAAQRRGLLHPDEAKRQGKQDNDLAEGFRIGGLGLWVEATLLADRILEF